jgi:uncharacterized circularly permuted ATP-grasp superfamily protein
VTAGKAFDDLLAERDALRAQVQRLESAMLTLSDNYMRTRQRLQEQLAKSRGLLRRAYDGMHKDHWANGESETEVCQAIRDFIDDTAEG